MELWKHCTAFAPVLSAVLVVGCVILSLGDYTAPTYAYDMTAKTPSDAIWLTSSDAPRTSTDAKHEKKKSKKKSDEETEEETTLARKTGSFDLEDGTYNGTATGFGGPITVAVTIQDGSIVSIEIVSAEKEDATFLKRAQGVIDKILAAQDWNVDVVSGATYSSNGIIHAVENALTGSSVGNEEATGAASAASNSGSASIAAVEESGTYRDGTYVGTGTGFGGAMSVQVVISGGKITSITVLQSNDGSDFLSRASSGVISAILSTQSTNVDTVSGATYSSVGIIQAVRSALSQASISGTVPGDNPAADNSNSSANTDNGTVNNNTANTGAFPYPDGTYYGVGEGYLGDIKLAMVISNHTITSITVLETSDDEAFFGRAKVLLERAISQQSTNLDTVSGATYSSNGLIEAMNACLESAKHAANSASSEDAASSSENNDHPSEPSSQPTATESASQSDNAVSTYVDGTYTATVTCNPDEDEDFDSYRLSLQITVKNDRITAVSDISGDGDSTNDTYIRRAADGTSKSVGVVTQIVQKGTVSNIDTVSRATCSSKSIIAACQQALAKAKRSGTPAIETEPAEPSGEVPETEESITPTEPSSEPNTEPSSASESTETEPSQPDMTENESSTPSATESTSEEPTQPDSSEQETEPSVTKWKDGTYSTSVLCVPDEDEDFEAYQLSLKVTIENDRIVSISDVQGDGAGSNDKYIKRAADGNNKKVGVVTQILDKQSMEVDAVSGATCSSKAIIEACEKALQLAENH